MSAGPAQTLCLGCAQPIAPQQGYLLCYMDEENVLQLAGEVCALCSDAYLEERNGMKTKTRVTPKAEPVLIERKVTLQVSQDTAALWDGMARRMNMNFDGLMQVLAMYGAFLLASADLGYLEGIGLKDLGPERIHPIVKQWLEQKVGPPAGGEG